MSQHILGIDISMHHISAVLVQSGISAFRIEGFRSVPIPVNSDDSKNAISLPLQEAIEPFIKTADRIAVSIPSAHFSFRNTRIPFSELNKIRQILPYEMESSLPYPIEDMVIDFDVLPPENSTGYRNIFVAAAEKKILGMYLDILSTARVEPETLSFQGYAGARVLAKIAHVPKQFIFVDLENPQCTIFIMDSGHIVTARNSSLPSRGKDSDEGLTILIRQMLLSLNSHYPYDFMAESIFILDDDPIHSNLYQNLGQNLKLPVIPVDLSTAPDLEKKVILTESSSKHPVERGFYIAAGEIERIKGMNFLRGPFSPKKRLAEHKTLFTRVGILLGTIFFLSLAFLLTEWQVMRKNIGTLDRQITGIFKSTFPEEKAIIDPYQQMKVKMIEMKKKPFLDRESAAQMRRIDILKEISVRISKDIDIRIGRLTIDDADVVLTGNTNSFNSVNAIKDQMETSPLFSQATISSAGLDRSGNRVDFTLTLKF